MNVKEVSRAGGGTSAPLAGIELSTSGSQGALASSAVQLHAPRAILLFVKYFADLVKKTYNVSSKGPHQLLPS